MYVFSNTELLCIILDHQDLNCLALLAMIFLFPFIGPNDEVQHSAQS